MNTGNANESSQIDTLSGMQKDSEDAIPEGERKLPALIEKIGFAVALSRASDGVLVDANETWVDTFGYTRQEAIGKTTLDLNINPDPEGRARILAQIQEKGYGRNIELSLRTKSGEWRSFLANVDIVEIGGQKYMLNTVQDITERKRAEEQVQQNNQKLNEILASIQDDFYVLDRDWNFVYANKLFTSKLGKEPEDFIGNNIWKMFPKHVGSTLEKNFRAAMEKREIRRFEIPGKYTDAWYRMTAFPSAEGITILGMDITERKRTEEQLRRQATLLSNVNDAIIASDAQFRIITWNAGAEALYGWKAEEVLGCNGLELIRTEWSEEDAAKMRQTISELGHWRGEATQVRKDGSRFPVEVSSLVLYDDNHEITGYISVNRDITERKRREDLSRALNIVNDSIHSTLHLNEVMQRAMDQAANALGCDTAAISLREGSTWVTRYVHGFPPATIGLQMNDNEERHAALAVQTKLPVAVNDAFHDERFNREHLRKWGVRSVLVVPLILREEAHGVIFFNYQQSQNVFTDEQIDFATKLSASLSLAMENARLLEDLQIELAQRKQAEEQLRGLTQRLTYHVDNSPLAVIEWGPDMRLIRWSGTAEQIFGWKAEEVLGKRIEDFRWVYDEDIPQVSDVSLDLKTGADSQRFSANRNYRKDGSVAYCEWYNSSLVDESGNLRSILSLVLDVTERKHAEDALRENEKQLHMLNETLEQKVEEKTAEVHQLASDLIKAVQHERHRISHLLHDDLQQRIYAIRMQLSLLRDKLQGESKAARQEIVDIEQRLAELLNLTRHVSIDLSPPILRDEGLSHAIEWLAAQMRQQYGLPIEIQADGPFAIADEALHVLLFNCVRELLFNVVKHALASQAVVALQWIDSDLLIEVRDNGRGFPVKTPEQRMREEISGQEDQQSGFGLSTIRHQLSLFGGRMEIHSEPGAGTQVILTVPATEGNEKA